MYIYICMLISSVNRETFFFPIWVLFNSFSWLIALVRAFNTMLSISGEEDIHVLFLILAEKHPVFHHKCDISSRISDALIRVMKFPCVHSILNAFIMKKCWILWISLQDNHVVFCLLFCWYSVYYVYYFWMLNYPCIPVRNPTWQWCRMVFIYVAVLFPVFLLSLFTLIFIRSIGLQFSFPMMFVWFWNQGNACLKEGVGRSSSCFWRNLWIILLILL